MGRLLDGLIVLDFTRVLSGPFCTMVMSDLGARVIKVEPLGGDDARAIGPFINGQSAYFASINRGKESIALDLKTPAGRDVARQLAERADVVVENNRPGAMARLGLSYDDLRAVNSRLVYASLSGFGQTGPYASRGAYDVIVQAMSGLMGLTGPRDGEPTRVGASLGDIIPALFTTIGILAALSRRAASNEGCYLDIGMFDAVTAVVENAFARFAATGRDPVPNGNRHPSIAPFETYPTADGLIVIAAGNDTLFERLGRVLGDDTLSADPRFRSNASRSEYADALAERLGATLRSRSTEEWLRDLVEAGVPVARVNRISDLIADPHLVARGMLAMIEQPGIGSLVLPGCPVKATGFNDAAARPAPRLGEHGPAVMQELLKYDQTAVATLIAQRVVGDASPP